MMTRIAHDSLAISPLEAFVRDYVEARDGVWDEIEPQVYDLLMGPQMLQVAFDPEALPEHPEAQLASLGSPLFDRLLSDAARRWNSARLYRIGLNLHPHGLESRVSRTISLPPDVSITIDRVRAMGFPQAVFWFKATFAGDQKEEEILPLGMDLHYLREVRHLDSLLTYDRLSDSPEAYLPEAKHSTLPAGCRAARGHVARTIAPLANARRREWAGRMQKQIARMSAYYAQLRVEADAHAGRSNDLAAETRAASRREAIDREEALRISELRQKSAIQVHVALASVMVIVQPKLLITNTITGKRQNSAPLDIVWDPLSETIEAVPCPACGQPTFAFRMSRTGLGCENCSR
jgi:hypothetical protein